MLLGMLSCRAFPTGATVADAVNFRGLVIPMRRHLPRTGTQARES